MHRAYQPITPANNLYLKHNWDKDVYRYHRKRVQAAKAVINNHPPKTYMHLHIKLKKLQIEDERLAIVEKDNRILIEKMAHIMRTGGRVDNYKLDYCRKSLNKTKRYRELLRITYENLAILKRINAKEPHYNHIKWAGEWQINRKYMMNITKYPNHWHTILQPIMQEGQREANRQIKSRREEEEKIKTQSSYQQTQLPKEAKEKGPVESLQKGKSSGSNKKDNKKPAPNKKSAANENSAENEKLNKTEEEKEVEGEAG